MGIVAKGFERRARAEGLIGPSDRVLAVEVGDLELWVSGGHPVVPTRADIAVGYTANRLVIVGAERVAAIDLVMLWNVEVLPSLGKITITYLHDQDEYRTTFRWSMRRRREAAIFAEALDAAVRRRCTDFPEHLQQQLRDWGGELDRRITEHLRVRDDSTDAVNIVTSIPIKLQRVAFIPAHATAALLEQGQRTGLLALLVDKTYAIDAHVGVVARFPREAITYLAIRNIDSSRGSSAAWELGYTCAAGERRVFFEASGTTRYPGMKLYPGEVDVSADAFLREAGLPEIIGTGDSWLETKVGTTSAAEPTPPAASGAPTPTASDSDKPRAQVVANSSEYGRRRAAPKKRR